MKNSLILLLLLALASCLNFDRGKEYMFLYDFENKETLSQNKMTEALVTLKKRFEKLGMSNAQVTLNNKNQIEIQAKTVLNEERLNKILLNQGKLEFWETFIGNEFLEFIIQIDATLKEEKEKGQDGSFMSLIAGASFEGGPSIFVVKEEDTAKVNSYLNDIKVRSLLTSNHRNAKFLWGNVNTEGNCELFAIKNNSDNKAPIAANHIVSASQNYDGLGRPTITIQMNHEGSKRWERITDYAYRNRTYIAITLNDIVFSAPGVSNGPIHGGNSEIAGEFTLEEAQDLAAVLSSGQSIPKLKLVSSQEIIEN